MQRVDAVDGARLPVLRVECLVSRNVQLAQGGGVGARLVGGDYRPFGNLSLEAGNRPFGRQHPFAGYLQEGVALVVDTRHHAHLLVRYATCMDLLAAMAAFPWHLEPALGVVALEGLGEVGLVELAAASLADGEGRQHLRNDLQQPPAHEQAGGKRYLAALCALPKRQPVGEALDVEHPGRGGELAHADDLAGSGVEGAAAAVAEVALGAVCAVALLDDLHAAAPGTGLHLHTVALGASAIHGIEQHGFHGLDCGHALAAPHSKEALPQGFCDSFGAHSMFLTSWFLLLYHQVKT